MMQTPMPVAAIPVLETWKKKYLQMDIAGWDMREVNASGA